jgi:hypothetical protein
MGRIVRGGHCEELPEAILVERKEVGCPRAYVACIVSDVFTRSENGFVTYHKQKDKCKIEGSHDDGPREEEGRRGRSDPVNIRALREATSRQSEEPVASDVTGYCMLELINTSAEVIEIGKNVKLGEGKPLKFFVR